MKKTDSIKIKNYESKTRRISYGNTLFDGGRGEKVIEFAKQAEEICIIDFFIHQLLSSTRTHQLTSFRLPGMTNVLIFIPIKKPLKQEAFQPWNRQSILWKSECRSKRFCRK